MVHRFPRHASALALVMGGVLASCAPDETPAPEPTPGASAAPLVGAAARKPTTEITIVLDVQPDDPVDVQFTTTGKKLRGFTLDDDPNSAPPSSRTFTRLNPGTYTVQQQQVAVGTLAHVSCVSTGGTENDTVDLLDHSVTIHLEEGESVVCTFRVGWADRDLLTFSHRDWGEATSTAGGLLLANYDAVYPTGLLEVSIPGTAGFSIRFFDALAVLAYLPAVGLPNPLVQDYIDSSSTSSGVFGGEVTALQLDVDFSDAALLTGTSCIALGDLTLCNFDTLAALEGLTVREFLDEVNTVLGGGSGIASTDELDLFTSALTRTFSGGTVSQFARDHLFIGACP